ncbi:ABC transporter ATP-binding protein [Natrarchaeobius halalkaliphilus]|uniref:ABC transporter ATP-binding protein n=1 Tax=Natrarchaeobius halalkaliphilus TaxID=1679091 RepID=A0A3N6LSH9_9EURY|nr:ABC transporter ATP-binding protein [Natrarchaeobius halalkaliphilus]RQG92898.1 ABC transporter ATP-binding protein [Natrarchaeobius halalkaliphilus]
MSVVVTNGLTKAYGDVTAINDLNLDIDEGEVFGFLGPNGAGKSTTINVLLDFVTPTAGSATILGHDTQENTREIHRRIGVLPEGYDLYDRLTGRRHIRFATATKQADDDPAEILERVGLDPEDADRAVGEYSKGMKQRLALGMALTGSPDLLILDEPSAGLDPSGIQRMQEIVRTEADRGTTVFFSSHILGQVEAVCDRVGVLNHGELVAIDTIEGLRETFGSGATVSLELDSVPESAVSSLSDIDGVTGYDINAQRLAVQCGDPRAKARAINHVEGAGATVLDIHVEEAGLHALFDELTGTDSAIGEPEEEGVIA